MSLPSNRSYYENILKDRYPLLEFNPKNFDFIYDNNKYVTKLKYEDSDKIIFCLFTDIESESTFIKKNVMTKEYFEKLDFFNRYQSGYYLFNISEIKLKSDYKHIDSFVNYDNNINVIIISKTYSKTDYDYILSMSKNKQINKINDYFIIDEFGDRIYNCGIRIKKDNIFNNSAAADFLNRFHITEKDCENLIKEIDFFIPYGYNTVKIIEKYIVNETYTVKFDLSYFAFVNTRFFIGDKSLENIKVDFSLNKFFSLDYSNIDPNYDFQKLLIDLFFTKRDDCKYHKYIFPMLFKNHTLSLLFSLMKKIN